MRTAFLLCALATMSHAAIVWTDFTSNVDNAGVATVTGSVGGVSVTYVGEGASSQVDPGATDHWSGFDAYDAATPTNTDAIILIGPSVNTITFGGTGVLNPILAIFSLGSNGNPGTYVFDKPFTIVDEGTGYFSSGPRTLGTNSITGYEWHGMIQFSGTVTSLQLQVTDGENYHGFTVGAGDLLPEVVSSVPEPSTVSLTLGAGLLLAALRRRVS